jgi:hypothetical protein
MFPYLILYPDAISIYIFPIMNLLTPEQLYLLIPKNISKLLSNDILQKKVGMTLLGLFPFNETTNLEEFTKTDIIKIVISILEDENESKNHKRILKFLNHFLDHFEKIDDYKTLKLIQEKSEKILKSNVSDGKVKK